MALPGSESRLLISAACTTVKTSLCHSAAFKAESGNASIALLFNKMWQFYKYVSYAYRHVLWCHSGIFEILVLEHAISVSTHSPNSINIWEVLLAKQCSIKSSNFISSKNKQKTFYNTDWFWVRMSVIIGSSYHFELQALFTLNIMKTRELVLVCPFMFPDFSFLIHKT